VKGEREMGNKNSGRARSIPAGIGWASLIMMGWTLTGAAITAWLILRGTMPEQWIGYCALVILIIGGYIGAWTSYTMIKHRRALVGGLAGATYMLCLTGVNAVFFGGQYEGIGATMLAILAGCGSWILMGLRSGKRRKQSRYKIQKV